MDILRGVLIVVHLIGFAVLFGAWAVQAFGGKREVTRLMNVGLAIAAVAGLALSAPFGDFTMNGPKIGVKLLVLIIIGAFIGIGLARQRKSGSVPPVLFWGIGVLTITNVALAVLW